MLQQQSSLVARLGRNGRLLYQLCFAKVMSHASLVTRCRTTDNSQAASSVRKFCVANHIYVLITTKF